MSISLVVVESPLNREMEEVEVGFDLSSIYSTFTFDVIERLGITPKINRINGRREFFCEALIHPEGDNQPPIPACVRLVPSIDGIDGTLGYPVFVEVADPFSVPWETYLRLPPECAERLKERVWDENGDWIREQIEERNAAWILVCNREIIKWSDDLKEYPSRQERKEIAKKHNLFPFVFARPPLIEETNWHETIYRNDYYPTLRISICGELELTGDMDTGAPITVLDRDQLISSGNLLPDPSDILEKDIFHREVYEYSFDEVHIQITDESGRKQSRFILCECVKDWRNSPFCMVNPNRQALVGRDILLEFPLEVRLNGRRKKTCIYLV